MSFHSLPHVQGPLYCTLPSLLTFHLGYFSPSLFVRNVYGKTFSSGLEKVMVRFYMCMHTHQDLALIITQVFIYPAKTTQFLS